MTSKQGITNYKSKLQRDNTNGNSFYKHFIISYYSELRLSAISRGMNLDVHLSEVSYKRSTQKYQANLEPSKNQSKGSIVSQIGLPSHTEQAP
jgi:hypothetical protein